MRSTSVAVGRVLGLLSLFLVVSVVAGALVAGLLVPGVAAAGGATRGSIDWFNGITTNLPDTRLQQTSQLLSADGKVIARFSDENRTEAPLNKISKNMQNAIIAIEDARFRDHGGVDPVGLMRAFASNEFGNGAEVQGASTLTQQYIKNLFLEQAVAKGDKQAQAQAVARDPKRKLLEIRAAIDLEKVLTKDQILERYLNIAYFGNGAYGIQAAAERYFHVSAAKLTIPQAALLAGMVQSPTLYNPLSTNRVRRQAALDRRNTVLDRMHELAFMSTRRWQSFRAGKVGLNPRAQQTGCIVATHSLAYFCEYVRTMIANGADQFKALGATQKDRLNALNRGGLKIYTTIDLKVQDAAVAAVTRRVPIGDKSKAASAAVTVEPGTGRVLAMTQNKKYGTKANDASTTTINYSVDTKYNGSSGMQTGSTFKAFTLAAYLKDGNGLRDTVDASVENRPFSDFRTCDGERAKGPTYSFKNSESSEGGRISVLDATAKSVNTAFVSIETKIPLCDITKTAESIGVHLAAPTKDCTEQATTDLPTCLPSLTLGPLSISPLTMAEAYAAFAADGTFCPAWPVEKILQPGGKQVQLNKPECKENALPADVAHGVTYALKQVLTRGTATRVWSGTRNIAGKTGTTDASKDTWFVGYTKQRATAVWVGDSVEVFQHRRKNGRTIPRQSLNGRTIAGHHYGTIFGATIAAPIWAEIMRTAIKGTDTGDWANPPSSMLAGQGVPVPDVRGRSIGEATGILSGAGFQVRIGRPLDSPYPLGSVASTSPSGGDSASQGESVTIYPSTGQGGATNAADTQPKPRPKPGRGGRHHHGGPPARA
jgi:membrane peptidoglycan carboxypeptidase